MARVSGMAGSRCFRDLYPSLCSALSFVGFFLSDMRSPCSSSSSCHLSYSCEETAPLSPLVPAKLWDWVSFIVVGYMLILNHYSQGDGMLWLTRPRSWTWGGEWAIHLCLKLIDRLGEVQLPKGKLRCYQQQGNRCWADRKNRYAHKEMSGF